MLNLWLFFIGNAIFLFPLYTDLYVIADKYSEKMYFSGCLFGLPVLGGYINRKGLRFYIHISEKKAFLFDLGKFITQRKKLFKIRGITPIEFRTVIKTGIESTFVNILPTVFLGSTIAAAIINDKRRIMSIRNDFTICCGDGLCVFMKFSFVFNLVAVNSILINALLKKVVKNNGRKK